MSKRSMSIEVDAASPGRTVLGHIAEVFAGMTAEVSRVVAEQTNNADAEFNIELGGNDVFNNEQSVDSADTPEGFVPDQNRYSSSDTDQIALDVSNAAGNAADQLIVTVVYDIE